MFLGTGCLGLFRRTELLPLLLTGRVLRGARVHTLLSGARPAQRAVDRRAMLLVGRRRVADRQRCRPACRRGDNQPAPGPRPQVGPVLGLLIISFETFSSTDGS
ncbi:hypothetical protein P1P75_09860 [Streptomyces sp. ID05-39B]|uniref:hypothetical protein n=1 Tax=Streptomyces sp. ID05-39B TaxID=3028664 RepID=UPI0029A362A3|nr:hypothetical protein [Streptomyces sp. ID05-39B]MDX3526741.1 hypothetical protein [Streptomyces sp. ID05-39B]